MKKYTDMRIFALEHGGIRSADVQSELSARYHSPATWRLPFKIGEANAFIMMNPELTSLISSINKRNMHLLLLKQTIPKSAIEQFAISSVEEHILCHKGAYMGKNGITRDRTGKPWYYRNSKR